MSDESRPVWGVIFGVLIIAAIGGLFIYGQKQRMTEEQEAEKTAAEEKKAKEVITIGGLAPQTGISGADDTSVYLKIATETAVQEINNAGGIKGRPIELVWEDSACHGGAGAATAQKLISLAGARYIIGGTCEQETLGIIPVAEQNKSIVLSPIITEKSLGNTDHSFFFSTSLYDIPWGRAVARYLLATNKKTLAIIYEADPLGQQTIEALRDIYTKSGGDIIIERALESAISATVPEEKYAEEMKKLVDKQLVPLLLEIKKTKPAALYLYWDHNNLFFKNALLGHLKKGLSETEIIFIGRPATSLDGLPSVATILDTPSLTEAGNKAVAAIIPRLPSPMGGISYNPPTIMVNVYSAVYLLRDAITAVGNNPEKVRNFLLNLRDWQGALGTLNFDKNGDRVPEYAVLKLENGVLKQVDTYSIDLED